MAVTMATTTPIAGASDMATLTLKTDYGNGGTDQSFSGTLPLTVTGALDGPTAGTPTLPTTVTFTDGVAIVPVTLVDATAQTLTFTLGDGALQSGTATLTPTAAVSAAQSITAPETSTGTTVTWTAPATGTAASYQVWEINTTTGLKTDIAPSVAGSATSYAVTGLTIGESYEFNVDAVDQYGNVVLGIRSSAFEYGSWAIYEGSAAGSTSTTGYILLQFDKGGIVLDATAADWVVTVDGLSIASTDYTVALDTVGSSASDNGVLFTLSADYAAGSLFRVLMAPSNTTTDAAGAPVSIPAYINRGLTLESVGFKG